MNILSIDTSSQILSIALLKNDSLIEESYSSDKKHSENIIPLLKNLIGKSNINFSSLNGVTFEQALVHLQELELLRGWHMVLHMPIIYRL